MTKSKLILITIFIFLFFIALFSYLKLDNIVSEHKLSAYLAWHNPTDSNLDNFYQLSKSERFLNYINSSDRTFENNMEVFDFLREEQKKNSEIPALLKDEREAKIPINFNEEEGIDLNAPETITYIAPGKLGYEVYSYDLLLFSPNIDTLSSKYLNVEYKKIDPTPKKTLTGEKSVETAETEAKEIFTNLLNEIRNSEDLEAQNIKLSESNLEKIKNKEIFENISVTDVTFLEKKFKEDEIKEDNLEIGNLKIHLENCFKDFTHNLNYSIEKGEIFLGDINSLVNKLCKKQFIKAEGGYLIGTCEDCTFYPADKTHALRPDYAPVLAGIGFAPGNQLISTKAYQDFYNLYNAAKKENVFINVTSGYRSYSTQLETFNSWVASELALGRTQAEAEAIANSYSARPGFSEHQLGTALDLNGVGCSNFTDEQCSSNESVWNWLAKNAYKYGFIQSYPAGKMSETGYTTEAWHYRWIGRDLAFEYVNAGGGTKITLNKFLLEKGLY